MILLTSYPGVAQLVARLTGGQEAVSSSLATRTSKKAQNRYISTVLSFFLCFLARDIFPIYILKNPVSLRLGTNCEHGLEPDAQGYT